MAKKIKPDMSILDAIRYMLPPVRLGSPSEVDSYIQFEEAFWHLWTLNCYHVTMSFDVNTVLLLDWALVYHMGLKK